MQNDKTWEWCTPLCPFLAKFYVQKERRAWFDSQQVLPRGREEAEGRLAWGWDLAFHLLSCVDS